MKIFNKIVNFAYTALIVICLIRLTALETHQLSKIGEIILAVGAVIKAMNYTGETTEPQEIKVTEE